MKILETGDIALQDRDGKVPGDLAELAGKSLLQLYAEEAPSKSHLVAALLKAQQIPAGL